LRIAVDEQPPAVDVNDPVFRDAGRRVEQPLVVRVEIEGRIRNLDDQCRRRRVS
jgi:hypothetical protein